MRGCTSSAEVRRALLAFARSKLGSQRAGRLEVERFVKGELSIENFSTLLDGLSREDWHTADRELDESERLDTKVVTILDTEYPSSLRNIPDPPTVLTVRGALAALSGSATFVAIVGTRRSSALGERFARQYGQRLTESGARVVSGLAKGIDTAAHRGAVAASQLQTELSSGVAVLGSGVCNIYPSENCELAELLVSTGGAIVSEYGVNGEPRRYHFPERNRIISGLSAGVLVVEAGEKSGAIGTARIAAEQGREVLAIPGDIGRSNCVGSNQLLRSGAHMVLEVSDLLSLFGLKSERREPESGATRLSVTKHINREAPILSPLGSKISEALDRNGSMDIDGLVETTGVLPHAILAELMNLEVLGVVESDSGGRYQRTY